MTSFKRRTPSRQVSLPPGTRTCPMSISTVLTSSGIPSLDDILGGGVPLSCLLVVFAPDSQSAYGELVQKYFVAQGIAHGHKVCILHEDALSFATECMWLPASRSNHPDEEDVIQSGEKIKIAFRYEQMKKFETTVANLAADHFCDVFDLTCRIPMSVIDAAYNAKRLIPLNLTMDNERASSLDERLREIERVLATTPSTEVVRLSITALGSPEWGEHCPTDMLRFLYSLRRLLRQYSHGCACVSLAPHLGTEVWTGSGWVGKVGWLTDAAISMTGFGANLALATLFPCHHGLVQIHRLPAPHSILPTSDKYSMLRGLSSSAAANIGTGENNLAFKCTRSRLIFETMHLDFEGGVAERRTTPSLARVNLDAGLVHTHVTSNENRTALASVAVEFEEEIKREGVQKTEPTRKMKKAKKKVAFDSEKPELYDF